MPASPALATYKTPGPFGIRMPRERCIAEVSNRYTYGWHGCRLWATWSVVMKSATVGPMTLHYCGRHIKTVDADRIIEAPRRLPR